MSIMQQVHLDVFHNPNRIKAFEQSEALIFYWEKFFSKWVDILKNMLYNV